MKEVYTYSRTSYARWGESWSHCSQSTGVVARQSVYAMARNLAFLCSREELVTMYVEMRIGWNSACHVAKRNLKLFSKVSRLVTTKLSCHFRATLWTVRKLSKLGATVEWQGVQMLARREDFEILATAWHALPASPRTLSRFLPSLARQIACHGVNRLLRKCHRSICVALTLCHWNGTTWHVNCGAMRASVRLASVINPAVGCH